MQYVIAGLVLGGIYAICAVGLTLTYTCTRIFNFAQGSIAFFVALAFYRLHTEDGWPTWSAFVVTVCVMAPLLGVVLWALLFRNLTSATPTVKLVATIGLAVALPPIAQFLFFDEQVYEAPGLAGSTPGVHDVLGVTINDNELIVLGAAFAVAVGMTVVLRATSFGLTVRAVVDAEIMSELVGTNSRLVSMGTWTISSALAGLAGVLVAPIIGLTPPATFLLLLISSFAAVVAGRLTSLTITFAAALGLGVLQGVVVSWDPPDWFPESGIRPSIPFLFMAVFLLAYRGLGRERAPREAPPPEATGDQEPTRRTRVPRALAVGVLVVLLPWLLAAGASPVWITSLAAGLALSIVFLSIVVVTGEGGLISLCQVTFAGIGAVTTANLATEHGWPLLPAVFVAGLVALPFGLLVALLALRLGDLYLALATLAFALLMENVVFQLEDFSNFGNGIDVFRPEILGFSFESDLRMSYLLIAVFGLLALVVANLRRSTTGMELVAMRSSETATTTLGLSVRGAKLVAFGLSAVIASIGGGMVAITQLRADPSYFNALVGLVWLAVVVIWGVRSMLGALLAGAFFALFPVLIAEHFSIAVQNLVPAFFGLAGIALAREPRGVLAANADSLRRILARRRTTDPDDSLDVVDEVAA